MPKNKEARNGKTAGDPEGNDGPPGTCHGQSRKRDAIDDGGLNKGADSATRGAFVTDSRNRFANCVQRMRAVFDEGSSFILDGVRLFHKWSCFGSFGCVALVPYCNSSSRSILHQPRL